MLLTRLEAEGVGPFVKRRVIDLGRTTIIKGKNGEGKSWLIRIVACLTGVSGESAQSLISRDANDEPLDVVPEIVGLLEGDGARYKITRRAKKLMVQVDENGAWRSLEPPDKALAAIFDRDSSPEALLDERLSDDKLTEKVLQVAEAKGYDRTLALARAELALWPDGRVTEDGDRRIVAGADGKLPSFTLQPIPAGLHPLEDLAKVQAQVFQARTDIERQRKAAASAAERLSVGLSADAPEDVATKVQASQDALDRLRAAQARTDAEHKEQLRAFRGDADAAIRAIEESYQERCRLLRETTGKLAEDTTDAIMRATKELAELRAAQDLAIADKARRDEAEKARGEAEDLAARHAALTRAITSLKAQAAAFVSDSFPGVTVDVTDEGKRRVLVLDKDGAWRTWSDVNEARRMEVAAAWSVLHQAKRGGAGEAQLALVLLDRGESLDSDAMRRTLASLSSAGQCLVTMRTDGELEFEVS